MLGGSGVATLPVLFGARQNTSRRLPMEESSFVLPSHGNPIVLDWIRDGKVAIMPSGCWDWQMYRDKNGYGSVLFEGKKHRVHRISINAPDSSMAMHSCDNPKCCNPWHLSLGSAQDNISDAVLKGRLLKPHMNKSPRCKCGRSVSGKSRQCLACIGAGRSCRTCGEYGRLMRGYNCARCATRKLRHQG